MVEWLPETWNIRFAFHCSGKKSPRWFFGAGCELVRGCIIQMDPMEPSTGSMWIGNE